MTTEVNNYFLVTALLLAIFGFIATWFLAGTHRGRPWDALYFVLSPVLLVTGLVNWDLMAVAMVAGALWAWSRDRPVLTGVLIGLGAATKLYPLFLLGPILVVAWRRRAMGKFALAAGAAAVAWARGQPAGLAHRVRAVEGLLELQRRPGRRPRLALAGALARRPLGHGRRHQPVVLGGVRRDLPRDRRAGTARSRDPAGGAAGLPGRRGVPAGEQGVLPAVRALAAPARRARAAAVARPPDLAGRGALLLRGGLDLPRRVAGGVDGRRVAGLRPRDLGAGRRAALPGGGRRARHPAPRSTTRSGQDRRSRSTTDRGRARDEEPSRQADPVS